MAKSVARITTEWHRGPNGKILPVPNTVDRDPRVQAWVAVDCNTWEKQGIDVEMVGVSKKTKRLSAVLLICIF